MPVKSVIKPSEYHDSVSLMLVAQELSRLSGVKDVAVVMATEANKSILQQAGLLTPEAMAASANDLVIAVSAAEETLEGLLVEAARLLQKKSAVAETGAVRPKTLRAALKQAPGANVCVISVAGRYAVDEAFEALRRGLHVLLFSDNVSLEDEIALKQYAAAHSLLLMGPGAGTAILNGVALGFANVLPPGPVGLVSAAGTGLQEVSTLLTREGVGVTQGIGVGGRDLSEAVGGIMMLAGLDALQADPATGVIVLISKPPAERVSRQVLAQAVASAKPVVICFLGQEIKGLPKGVTAARTLEEAARQAASLVKSGSPAPSSRQIEADSRALALRKQLRPGQRYLRGLFSGGTLCYEAQVIWREMLPGPVYSNAPLDKRNLLADATRSVQHSAIDLGEEEFTVGRLHPMIDNSLRVRRMLQEADDTETALIVLDVVLGYGAHPNPAAELAPAVRQARLLAESQGREMVIVASITGTDQDPQPRREQSEILQAAGVIVCTSNAAAARFAAHVVQG